jgi:sensor histidine kinase YesM
MIRFLYRHFYYRLLTGSLAGLLGYMVIITVFSLQYRYYAVPLRWIDILSFLSFGIVMQESIVQVNRWLDRKVPWTDRPFRRLGAQALAGFAITLFWIVAVRLALILLLFPQWLIILSDELVTFLVVLFMAWAFALTELGVFLNTSYRNSLAELERFRKENVEYQFEMLKLQLNPHFLFNSLNTLSSLVYEDAEKSSEFIRRLSDVYRYVLDNRDRELVPLKKELEFISSYTFLLSIRFQDMVFFVEDVDEAALEKQIAPMTVQLLVENAVKHNVASRQRPLTIDIFTEDNDLWVVNNLQLKDKSENSGVGLKNIKSRYAFLTDREVEIITDVTAFKVKIPLIG